MILDQFQQIALILCLGSLGNIVAWKLRLPTILLLLLLGILFGQIGFGLIDPDYSVGKLIFPATSIAVAIILFEGGLTLKFSELSGIKYVVFSLISVGVLVTWLLAGFFAFYFLSLDLNLAILIGAICTVSGPTVVLPLLRFLKPRAPCGEILKWEGMLVDPVGALLAVLVFETIKNQSLENNYIEILFSMILTLSIGTICGVLFGKIIASIYQKRLVPESQFNTVAVFFVVFAYALSDYIHAESGLLAVTLIGIILANTKNVNIKPILEFKENLVTLLIGALFIILSARIKLQDIASINPFDTALFVLAIIVIVRPLSVFISTFKSNLNIKQKLFLGWFAPRGIVAAAVASLFSIELQNANINNAHLVGAYTFIIISSTVVVYSLTSGIAGRYLKVTQKHPNGILFISANELIRDIALLLKNLDIPVILIDSNSNNVDEARQLGLTVYQGDALSENIIEQLNLDGIGSMLAMTPNSEANYLATLRYREIFGHEHVYQLNEKSNFGLIDASSNKKPRYLRGKYLFNQDISYDKLINLYSSGYQVKVFIISDKLSYSQLLSNHNNNLIALFLIKQNKDLFIFTNNSVLFPVAGDKILCLVSKFN